MVTDIKNVLHPPAKGTTTGRADEARVGKADRTDPGSSRPEAAPRTEPTDTVALTSAALKLKELEGMLAQTPVVDVHRVGELRMAIENGSYDIRPDRIEERLLETEGLL